MTTTGKKSIRGVGNIRTMAGRSDRSSKPYQAYFRLGALEMEKARRAKERESAMRRVNNIDIRCRELEAEKKTLLKIISPGQEEDYQKKTGGRKGAAANFKIRY